MLVSLRIYIMHQIGHLFVRKKSFLELLNTTVLVIVFIQLRSYEAMMNYQCRSIFGNVVADSVTPSIVDLVQLLNFL
jgi:hypothetical protein